MRPIDALPIVASPPLPTSAFSLCATAVPGVPNRVGIASASHALHTARRAALPLQERLAIVRASKASWARLKAAQKALERAAG